MIFKKGWKTENTHGFRSVEKVIEEEMLKKKMVNIKGQNGW